MNDYSDLPWGILPPIYEPPPLKRSKPRRISPLGWWFIGLCGVSLSLGFSIGWWF